MAGDSSDIPLLLECEEDGLEEDVDDPSDDEDQVSAGNVPTSSNRGHTSQSTAGSPAHRKKLLQNSSVLDVKSGGSISRTPMSSNDSQKFKINKISTSRIESKKSAVDTSAEIVDLTEDDENVTPPTTNGEIHIPNSNRNTSQRKVHNQRSNSSNDTSTKVPVVDLTEDDEAPVIVKSVLNEKTANSHSRYNNTGRGYKVATIPSIVIKQKPILRICGDDSDALANKVKPTLALNPMKLTEWLINEGLLNCEQYCQEHTEDGRPKRLKLAMYSNTSKFPLSGGYCWICNSCPLTNFVSVFHGSILEEGMYQPSVILKLIYHWACQVNDEQIERLIKMRKNDMEDLFNKIRSVCTAAIHEKFGKLGGKGGTVQVGMLSFSVMNAARVKFKVLGALDVENKQIRLEVLDPTNNNIYPSVVQLLNKWIQSDSKIVTNCLLIKGTLMSSGFRTVSHSSFSLERINQSNVNIMQYLSEVVPKVFQEMKPSFSLKSVQLYLNEIVYREKWGFSPLRAFETIMQDISSQTKPGISLIKCLSKISSFPFANWEYSKWKENCAMMNMVEPKRKPMGMLRSARCATVQQQQSESRLQRGSVNSEPSGQSISLDSYYYGEVLGEPEMEDFEYSIECFMCNRFLASNIDVMHHLIRYNINGNRCVPLRQETHLCHYCLLPFRTPVLLNSHYEEVHFQTDVRVLCRICNMRFNERTRLIAHMSHFHNELDLPYSCGVCGYRTSEHYLAVDHFYDDHKESGHLQCPLCLKVFIYKKSDCNLNLYQFVFHIKKHGISSLVHKCNRCQLAFVNKDAHKEHWEMHNSCKIIPYTKKYKKPSQGVLMPKPLKTHVPKVTYQGPTNVTNASFFSQVTLTCDDLNPLQLSQVPSNSRCFECEGVVNQHHYLGQFTCRMCKYETSCTNAMNIHIELSHKRQAKNCKQREFIRPILLERFMQCPCGKVFKEGNRLARHLVECGNQTGYMLPKTPDILASLGLIRKVYISETDSEDSTDGEQDGASRRSKRPKFI